MIYITKGNHMKRLIRNVVEPAVTYALLAIVFIYAVLYAFGYIR